MQGAIPTRPSPPEQLETAIARSSFDNLRAQEEQDGFRERPEQSERFFRDGRSDQWREVLTGHQVARIVRNHGEQMARFGYLPTQSASPAGTGQARSY
jgi:hypothetical protein